MELRQLKYFVKVAETLNFSEASRTLFITQSTLSQQIKQLEQEIGSPLFQRDSHRVCLTEAGSELLPYAVRTLQASQLCLERMNDLRELLAGTLNIGVTYSFSPILTETLLDFMKLYPGVKLNIFYKPMAELMDMLVEREVDFVLAFKPKEPLACVESHSLFQNFLTVVVNSNHPLASKQKVTLAELSEYDLALPARGLQARNYFDAVIAPKGIDMRVRIELNEVNILLKLISCSSLATVLAEATTHNVRGVKAVPLDIPANEMTGCVHTLRDSYHKRSMCEFIKMLSESAAIRERVNAWL
ncbi:LysR family transcriptional regulator [Duncaniella muris]|uniref:LysR family transcriptional regulator n=5 Tax=Duncaniella muris TaxID=2094150 RepID=A0A2V1IMY6_9BACT|nr:LysR substrate-binding domain-containing protein [Duncaniella muris]PWB03395.1 LysR family transcriptional regulator [Duncaniella muris]